VADVFLHRGQRHDELVGDLLVGLARGQQPQHLQLAAAQRLGQPRLPGVAGGRRGGTRRGGRLEGLQQAFKVALRNCGGEHDPPGPLGRG
jgi:hypothetical protein